MVQRHLESDKIPKESMKDNYFTDYIFQFIAKVSRNMSSHHTCSMLMNNVD